MQAGAASKETRSYWRRMIDSCIEMLHNYLLFLHKHMFIDLCTYIYAVKDAIYHKNI